MGTMQFISFCTYAVVLWYGTVLIRQGNTTGGSVMTVFFSVMMGGSSLGQAAPSLDAIARGRGAAKNIYAVIDRQSAIDARSPDGEQPAACVGALALRDVSFTYSARPDAPIFAGLSLAFPAGRMTALVGESGSGKSTVIQLIMRFYDPLGGAVTLDGRDVRSLNVGWLRAQVALVSQEPVLFATSVVDNLRYGRPDATQAQLEAACRAANAHTFITAMVDGYDTYVGERGAQLSGGQKQRIAIARAVLRDPRVLLLDEATSALDNESERAVQAALDSIRSSGGRTTIAVAHRLSTIRDADAIVVLRRGVVLEQGSHDELAGRPEGAYAALLALQARAPELPSGSDSAFGRSMASAAAAPPAEAPSLQKPRADALSLVAVEVHSDGDAKGKAADCAAAAADAPPLVEPPPTKVPFSRLAALSLPEAHWFMLGTASSAAAGTFFPIFSFILSRLLVVFYMPPGAQMAHESFLWCMMFFALACSSLIITVLQNTCAGLVGQHCVHRVRRMALTAALRQEVAYFDDPKNNSGALTARLSGDAALLRMLVSDGLFSTLQNFATFVTGIVIAFVGGWQLTLIMMTIMPLTAASYYVAAKRLSALAGDTRALFERATQIATDAVSNIRTVAAFGAEKRVLRLFDDALAGPLRAASKAARVGGYGHAFSQVMATLPPAASFYVGGKFIVHGIMTFEGVMQVFFALVMSAVGVSQVSAVTGDVGAAQPAAVAVFQLLDRRPVIDAAEPGGLQPEQCVGALALRDVAFAYPTRLDVPVFSALSLRVDAGRTLALVGESGSGKSTVIQLMLRFYDPLSGAVFLDGQDLRQLNIAWLRRQMGLVSQEPALFATSLAENIAFGAEDAEQQAVQAAAAAANAHGFITDLPDGYATQVGERGVQLSGGQKQRIAIARAVLRDPRVLLLDEATSALDNESERAVQAALEKLMAGRTCVVVAHRLTTIRNAHAIAVMRAGNLVEQGSHDELAARQGGAYAQLMAVRGDS
jgi:ATP-binding cassette subfamily B (MDR/TAP) protein 1